VKILVTEPEFYSSTSLLRLENLGEVFCSDINTNAELDRELKVRKYDVVFAKLGLEFDTTFFMQHPEIRYLATPTTGLTHINLQVCEARKVTIISLKDEIDFLESITTTAEHIWFLLLSLARQNARVQKIIAAGKWCRQGLSITQLSGKNLGIIGYGRLGEIVSSYGDAFRMNVHVYDKKDLSECNVPDKYQVMENLASLLTESDFIVLTASFLGEKILDNENINSIKHGACLINASRGELVDEDQIIRALDSGLLSGYATDVLNGDSSWDSSEKVSSPVFEKAKTDERVFITPHIGGYAIDAIQSTRNYLVELVLGKLASQ
jgi:D-3-phosphoglycerate dehydrogenase / 2-oxoglutarate reductase